MNQISEVKHLIKKLESKTYKGENISFSELKKYLEQQNEEFWLDFELALKSSRQKHTKKERISLTLKELRKWKREWKNKLNASPNQKKVGQAGEVGQKVGQKKKNESFGKVKKLIKDLEDKVLKKKIIFKGSLKMTLSRESEEFREEFEKQLKTNRKKDSKYRIPLTIEELNQWRHEWGSLEVSPVSNPPKENSDSKSLPPPPPPKIEKKQVREDNTFNSQSLSLEKSCGPFIYDIRNNKLWYQNQPINWRKRSKMGGDWFENSQMRIYIQRLDNWNISVHAKIGLSLTYKGYFSCFKTEKLVLFFGPWNQVYQNKKGEWERKEDLEVAEKFLARYNLKLPGKNEKSKN